MAKVLIVIVSYNAKRYMQECIYSLREKLTPGSYGIFVVDNASTDGIAEWLSEQKDITLIKNDTNVGFGPACNQAVLASVGTEFEDADVFLLNNDTVMTSTALPRMIKDLNSSKNIGAVGAMSNYAGNRQQIDVTFSTTEEYIAFGESLNAPKKDSFIEKTRLNGFAMLIRRSVWNDIGGFDEDFAPGYYEDDALSIEILKRGYRLILERNSFIYHVGSASFVKTGTNTLSYEHHDLFIRKYGFDILDYVYPCGAVISQIPRERSDKFRVLHLGCGLGAEMKAIRSLYPKADVYGIETNKVLYDIVKATENVFSDVYEALAETGKGFFDVLIVDSEFLIGLTDDDKKALAGLCGKNAVEISRIHEYDDYCFDDIRLVLWDHEVYNHMIAEHLSNWGIMSSVYYNDNLKKRLNAYGLPYSAILLISSDNSFRGNAFLMMPELKIADTTIIPYLTAHFGRLPMTDPGHNNEILLKVIESRYEDMKAFGTPDEFLGASDISVTVHKNCYEKIRDIHAMLNDCYLLDYVKKGSDLSSLERMICDTWNDCGYITAKDRYADYGIVGFYCMNKRTKEIIRFAFSYAVSGMHIEQYIFNKLGCPEFDTCLPVLSALRVDLETPWISEEPASEAETGIVRNGRVNILLKGDKSLKPIADYLIGGNVTTELDNLSKAASKHESLPTKLYSDPFHIIVYSMMQHDLSPWESDSDACLKAMFETLDDLCDKTPGNPMIILLLGSEVPGDTTDETDRKLAELHGELRPIIEEYAAQQPKIRAINVTDLIKDQSDFDGSVNRFGVRVYSDIVEKIVVYINEKVDELTR